MFSISSMKGKGYKSFLMVTFNFWKFTQIMNLPFFFSTMMMGDNHVAFSMGLMNLTTNNLSMSYLTITT
jgi:hypothetical protein